MDIYDTIHIKSTQSPPTFLAGTPNLMVSYRVDFKIHKVVLLTLPIQMLISSPDYSLKDEDINHTIPLPFTLHLKVPLPKHGCDQLHGTTSMKCSTENRSAEEQVCLSQHGQRRLSFHPPGSHFSL